MVIRGYWVTGDSRLVLEGGLLLSDIPKLLTFMDLTALSPEKGWVKV